MAKKKLALAEPAWIQRYQKTGQRTDVIRDIHNTTRVYRRSVCIIYTCLSIIIIAAVLRRKNVNSIMRV